MVPSLHSGCFRSPCWLSSFASIIPLRTAPEWCQRLCLQPGNAVLSAPGLSCQLRICNLSWLAGPALAAWFQFVGVEATWALGGFLSSSCQWQGDPEFHRHGPCGGPDGDNAGQASRDALAVLQEHCAKLGSKVHLA